MKQNQKPKRLIRDGEIQQVPSSMDSATVCDKPKCNKKHWNLGYGMAGGGMGPYLYCTMCEQVVGKDNDNDAG